MILRSSQVALSSVMLTIPLRIVLLDPPAGVAFCLQKGKGGKAIEVDHQISQSGEDLTFSLSVNVKDGPPNSIPNFVGPYSQGTAAFLLPALWSTGRATGLALGAPRKAAPVDDSLESAVESRAPGRQLATG